MYEPISSQINSAWKNVELSDLLLLYKQMVLGVYVRLTGRSYLNVCLRLGGKEMMTTADMRYDSLKNNSFALTKPIKCYPHLMAYT